MNVSMAFCVLEVHCLIDLKDTKKSVKLNRFRSLRCLAQPVYTKKAKPTLTREHQDFFLSYTFQSPNFQRERKSINAINYVVYLLCFTLYSGFITAQI